MRMSAPDGRVPRPRALRDRSPSPPLSPPGPSDAASPRTPRRRPGSPTRPPTTRSSGPTRFGALLGHRRPPNELSRQVLARYVHRDDHAKALGAITRAVDRRRVRARHGPAGARRRRLVRRGLPARAGRRTPTAPCSGVHGTVQDVSARERARREVARLARRGETVQASVLERDPATGLLTRARFADEVDRAMRRGGGAVLVIRVEPDRGEAPAAPPGPPRRPAAARRPGAGERAPPGPDLLGPGRPERDRRAAGRRVLGDGPPPGRPVRRGAARAPVRAARRLAARPRLGRAGPVPAGRRGRQPRPADRRRAGLAAGPRRRPAGDPGRRDRCRPATGRASYRDRVADALGTDRFTLFCPADPRAADQRGDPARAAAAGPGRGGQPAVADPGAGRPPSGSTRSSTSTSGWSSGPCSSPPSAPTSACRSTSPAGRWATRG